MTSQPPANGVLQRMNYGGSKSYQVTCECMDPGHDHIMYVEADGASVTVTIFTTAKSKWWSTNRWKKMWSLMTKGYIEYEADLIMNEQQALNYADALKSAIEDVKEFRKQQ